MDLSAISGVVQTIGGLLTKEVTSLLGVEEQVESLHSELIWMQSFLKVADTRKAENDVVRTSVAKIRELAYDAEDVIETFSLKVASKRKGGISNFIKRSTCFLNEGWLLCQAKKEIENITAKIRELTGQLQRYDVTKLGDGEGSSSSNERLESRRLYPHIIDDNIVGLDEGIKKLVSVLVDKESDCRVVSICGMGGLGKTTLAKKIYRHSQVIGQFNHLAWVYVSQQCQKIKVWEDILSKLTSINERGSKQSDEELAEKLSNFLKKKKCLVILDDIWSIQTWDSIKPGFPTTETSSKILLTSRNKEVASHADRRGYLYELQCLKDEESWELFQKIAFPDRDSPDYKVDAKMEELGKDMVKNCSGWPLAIIVLGGILATKYSSNQWQAVNENVKSYLKRGKEVLALSYDDLPPHLKSCFLYLSHFPEDYEIHAYKLIQLWVADGIVSSMQDEENGGKILEDVAEDYLNELVERYMIRPEKRDPITGKIKTCQMHDLMRDLCLSKAKEEDFLYIIDHSNAYPRGNSLYSSTIRKVRRVAAHEFVRVECIQNQHLRSLFFFDEIFPDYDENLLKSLFLFLLVPVSLLLYIGITKMGRVWIYIFNNFKLLRVLDFERKSFAGCKLPSDIGNLIHLRFLSLRGFTFLRSKLPSSLGNLRCLQTLDLRVECNSSSVHVPNDIWKMEQLRHLYLPERCNRKTKLKLGTLRNLQTLVNFNTENCYLEDLLNMIKLRELMILGPFHIETFEEDLEQNQPIISSKCLHSLSIDSSNIDPRHLAHLLSCCVNICEFIGSIKGRMKLPEYRHFSSIIAYIDLSGSEIEEDPMPTLEKLPNLRILELHDSEYRGGKMVCSAQRFLKLDSLSLRGLCYLEEWKVEEGAMPALRHLEITNCGNLKMLPDGLKFITTLLELKIERMPKAFKNKVVEGGEDLYKVQHVPSIIFQNCDR
ncbi:hypothetical protein CRYUN_Cryun38cG0045100 [Craigia yunnanensis]